MGYNKDLEIENKLKPKIFHLLNVSLPDLSGYSIRSHNILKHQKEYCHIYAITEPAYIQKKTPDNIENILYFRFPPTKGYQLFFNPKIIKIVKKAQILNWYYRIIFKNTLFSLKKLITFYKPDILHVHSSHFYGYYISKIAKKLKIPFIFEVRGFLEDTHVGLGILKKNSLQYNNRKKFRRKIIKKADKIVTLGYTMKEELISQGIERNKIIIVPNGVDTEKLYPKPPLVSLKEKLGIKNEKLLGYIGSIRRIEGIEILLKAMEIIKREIKDVFLLIIGPGDPIYINELKIITKKLKINNYVKFLGPVPNSEIDDYYSILNICIIPRLNIRVNQLVTPLKPLEVMAMGKVLLVSNLPALKELVKPNISGELFETENSEDLADKIMKFIINPEETNRLGQSARKYVENNYSWQKIIKKYISLYESLL